MDLVRNLVVIFSVVVIVAMVTVPVINDSVESEDEIYVFVLTGQSNAAYLDYDVSVANSELTHISQGKAYYYGTADSVIKYGSSIASASYDTTFESYAIHDMVDSSGDFIIGNIEAAFASKFVSETGKNIAIINTGIGGQSITDMMPGGTGNDWNVEVYDRAVAGLKDMGFKLKYASILFSQGESDAQMAVDTYKADFELMLDSYTDETHCKTLILNLVRPNNASNPATAQQQLASELSNVYLGCTATTTFTYGNGMLRVDNVHYTQYGDDVIGQDLAECYYETVNPSVMDSYTDPVYNNLVWVLPVMIIAAIVAVSARVFFNREN